MLAPPHDPSSIVRTLSDSWIPAIGPGQSWSGVHSQASAASCWVNGPRTIPIFFTSSKVALISSVNSLAMDNCPFLGGVDSLGAGLLPLGSKRRAALPQLPCGLSRSGTPGKAALGSSRAMCLGRGVPCCPAVKPCIQGAQREGHYNFGHCGGGVLPHDGLPPPSLSGLV